LLLLLLLFSRKATTRNNSNRNAVANPQRSPVHPPQNIRGRHRKNRKRKQEYLRMDDDDDNNGKSKSTRGRRGGGYIWAQPSGSSYWHNFAPPTILVRFFFVAVALSAMAILAAEMGPHGTGHSRAVMDTRNRRAVQARMVGSPAEHILFLVSSSQAVEDAMVAALRVAAPSAVTEPVRLRLPLLSSSSNNHTLSPEAAIRRHITAIEAAWRLHAGTRLGRDLPQEAWTTVLVVLPRPSAWGGQPADRLWNAELPAIIGRLTRAPTITRISLAVVREYLPGGVARSIDPRFCGEHHREHLRALHTAIDEALRLGKTIERLQERLVEDGLDPTVYEMDYDRDDGAYRTKDPGWRPLVVVSDVRAEALLQYAPPSGIGSMKPTASGGPHQRLLRWMRREAGVWSDAICPSPRALVSAALAQSVPYWKHFLPTLDSHKDGQPCPLALATTLRYIASLPIDRLHHLPRLPHLALWRSSFPNGSTGGGADGTGEAKIVAVTQVRNVEHTLLGFLKSMDWLADAIVILDTGSVDSTVRLAQAWAATGSVVRCPLTVIQADQLYDTKTEWHEGQSYGRLLDEARTMGATHILTPDSDEYLTYNWRRHGLLRNFMLSLPVGVGLAVRLFHVYDGIDRWVATRPSGWTQEATAPLGWHDDGAAQRTGSAHRLSRMPNEYRTISLNLSQSMGSIHFKFASLQGSLATTVWYKHLEWKQGHRSRATSSFHDKKMPRVSAGSGTSGLQPVPSDEWYGPPQAEGVGSGSMRRWASQWTDQESWAWRVRMVELWRRQARDPFPFRLPVGWPFGVEVMTLPASWQRGGDGTDEPHLNGDRPTDRGRGGAVGGLDPLDRECRRGYVVGKNMAAAGTPSISSGMSIADAMVELATIREGGRTFLWANPDRRVYRWLKTSETHLRDFVHHALPSYNRSSGDDADRTTTTTTTIHPPLVLDVGAHSGFYGLWGLAAGYDAIFVESEPYCNWLLDTALAANGWVDRALTIKAVVGTRTRDVARNASARATWCSLPCTRRLSGPPRVGLGDYRSVVRIDDLVPVDRRVALLKLRVGHRSALSGARRIFGDRQVAFAAIEVTPLLYRKLGTGKEREVREALHKEMEWIRSHGYRVCRPSGAQPQNSNRDYRCLHTSDDLRRYLLEERFARHDVLVTRLGPAPQRHRSSKP
jgi:hypothetical protein